METFGERIRTFRILENKTQKQLAEEIMMPKSLISYFEVGHGYPSAESLEILADHFGVTMDYLWKGTK